MLQEKLDSYARVRNSACPLVRLSRISKKSSGQVAIETDFCDDFPFTLDGQSVTRRFAESSRDQSDALRVAVTNQ